MYLETQLIEIEIVDVGLHASLVTVNASIFRDIELNIFQIVDGWF